MTQDVVKQIAQLAKAGVPLAAIPAILAGMAGGTVTTRKGRSGKGASVDQGTDRLDTIRRTFKRRGFTVTLRDPNDPSKPFDVRPFGRAAGVDKDGNAVPASGWIGQGRVVRKGQKGVMGLFHISQTDPLPAATS